MFGGTPLPYLKGIAEHDDGASPTSHWRAEIEFRDLARFLARDGLWPEGRPISRVRGDGSRVTVRGAGRSSTLESSAFRDAVNGWAPCLEPQTYPEDSLPVTIPSHWVTITSHGGAAIATGRGWGHGVGMVQWGAYGKAKRGLSASRILAAYYGGFRPKPFPEPGLIHVQIATGLKELRVVASGRGAVLAGEPIGLKPVTVRGGDELTVRPRRDDG